MIYPDFLKKDDIIGITAPSDGRSNETDIRRLESAEEAFVQRGYGVSETAHVRCSEGGKSAPAAVRGEEFMSLIENNSVKAVVCASGGDWLFEMLDFVDYESIAKHPKWICGMSDPTGLTFTAATLADVASVYCVNAGDYGMRPWDRMLEENLSLLEGKAFSQKSSDSYQSGWAKRKTGLETYEKDAVTEWKVLLPEGKSETVLEGRMIGGCLDVLCNLVGTPFDKTAEFADRYKKDGILWYLEVFQMTPEQICFAIWQMKKAGWFKNISGVIFGRPAMVCEDYSSISYYEAVKQAFAEFDIPVVADADIGHRPPSLTMVNGAVGKIVCRDGAGEVFTRFA